MKSRTSFTAGLAIAGVFAFASPAQAASVERHLDRADASVEKAMEFSKDGRDKAAIAHLRRADRETSRAHRHNRSGDREDRALDERRIAKQFQENAETSAKVVARVDGKDEVRAAGEVEDAVEGREKALERLTALAERLPSQAQKGLAKSISQVTMIGTRPATTLDRAMRAGDVEPQAADDVEQAIAAVGEGSANDVSVLDELMGIVPEPARKGLEKAREKAQAGKDRAQGRRGGAQVCKAEREADPVAFDDKYRTNEGDATEESNAFGMCVSGHSKAFRPGSKGAENRPDFAGPPSGVTGAPTDIPTGPPAGIGGRP